MVRFKMMFVRPPRFITLEFLEGRPLVKGIWWRVPDESNSSLGLETGDWENWVFGTPGGVRHIRLYDSADANVALLMDFPSSSSHGHGTIVTPGFGGAFGDEDFHWSKVSAATVPSALPARTGHASHDNDTVDVAHHSGDR